MPSTSNTYPQIAHKQKGIGFFDSEKHHPNFESPLTTSKSHFRSLGNHFLHTKSHFLHLKNPFPTSKSHFRSLGNHFLHTKKHFKNSGNTLIV